MGGSRRTTGRWLLAALLAVVSGVVVLGVGPSPAAADGSELRFSQARIIAEESQGYVSIQVDRVGGLPVSRLEVDYATGEGTARPGTDYVPAAGTLVFNVGATSATFAVFLRDDHEPERTEEVTLLLSDVRGGNDRAGVPATLVILDDDQRAAAASPAVTATNSAARPPLEPSGTLTASQPLARRPLRVAHPPIISTQRPGTPFELRVETSPARGAPIGLDDLAVDPGLALLAGLLLARIAAGVWFAYRCGTLSP